MREYLAIGPLRPVVTKGQLSSGISEAAAQFGAPVSLEDGKLKAAEMQSSGVQIGGFIETRLLATMLGADFWLGCRSPATILGGFFETGT